MMVIVTHWGWESKAYPPFTFGIRMAVPVFFLLSGYNSYISYSRKKDDSLKALYAPSEMLPKLGWILLPYTVLYIIEAIYSVVTGIYTFGGVGDILGTYLTGGINRGVFGGYYVTLLLEFTILSPLFYSLMKKNPFSGLLCFLVGNILYELCVSLFHMPNPVYRLILLRYIFMVGVGYFMAIKGTSADAATNILMILSFAAGVIYLCAYDYHGYMSNLTIYWRSTCLFSFFYAVPVIWYLFYFFKDRSVPSPIGKWWAVIGSSTWHIFLFQMVWYRLKCWQIYGAFPLFWIIFINELICVSAGVMWQMAESRMRKAVRNR